MVSRVGSPRTHHLGMLPSLLLVKGQTQVYTRFLFDSIMMTKQKNPEAQTPYKPSQ
jgi:hypothetical protein